MISFNEYQQSKTTNFLAIECFNMLCNVGIDPNNFLEWLVKKDFQVNDVDIKKFVVNNSFSLNEAGVSPPPVPPLSPKRTPLQIAMQDPARKGMVQRALQSLDVLKKHLDSSIKRGGLLGKQPDFNQILNSVISSVTNLSSGKSASTSPPPLPKDTPKSPPPLPKDYVDSYKNPDRFSDHYEQPDGKKLLKEWIKTESLLKQRNIDVKLFLHYLNETKGDLNESFAAVDALASGAMGAVGGFFTGGFKGAAEGAKTRYHASLDKAEINAMTDVKNNLDILVKSLPDKNAPIAKQLQAFNAKIKSIITPETASKADEPKTGEQSKVVEPVIIKFSKALEIIKSGKELGEQDLSMIEDKEAKQQLVNALTRSLPIKDGTQVEENKIKYTFKKGKWYYPTPGATVAGGAEEAVADDKTQEILNAKYPPDGDKLDAFWALLKDLELSEKAGKLEEGIQTFYNKLKGIKQIPDKLQKSLVQIFKPKTPTKNESIYYRMDYTKYVSDLING